MCIYLFIFGATYVYAFASPLSNNRLTTLAASDEAPSHGSSKGMVLSTSIIWISNFIIAFTTPPLFGSIQGGYYFLLGFTCISGLFVYFVYPETASTLEELGEVLVISRWMEA